MESEHFAGTFITESFSLIRIDMAHHKGYLFLGIRCYIGVFWDDSADHLMTDFAASFLIRGWWVAVKNAASSVAVSIEFDAFRVREFTAVIGQTHGKQGYKNIGPKFKVQPVKNIWDRSGIIMIAAESKLEASRNKSHCKEYGTIFDAFYRIQLDDRCIGILTRASSSWLRDDLISSFFVLLFIIILLIYYFFNFLFSCFCFFIWGS